MVLYQAISAGIRNNLYVVFRQCEYVLLLERVFRRSNVDLGYEVRPQYDCVPEVR